MELIEKKLGIASISEDSIKGIEKLQKLMELPDFLTKLLVTMNLRFNLEKVRQDMENPNQVQLNYSNKITKIKRTIMGYKREIGLSIYFSDKKVAGRRPLFYHIHGGGWIGGSSEGNDNFMRFLADKTDFIIASVDYNLAPKAKYPEPLEDCYEGLFYMINGYKEAEIDKDKVIISGDSAGGNLAAGLNLKLADENKIRIYKQILYYPITTLYNAERGSYLEKGLEYSWMRINGLVIRNMYLKNKKQRKLPYVSPLYAKINNKFPDTLILIAERDGLRSDGIEYGEHLAKAGVNVRCVLYKGAFHAFLNDLGRSETADDAANEVVEFINTKVHQ